MIASRRRRQPLLIMAVAIGLVTAAGASALAQSLRAIEVAGTQFRVTVSDGSILTSRDLVGAVLTLNVGGTSSRVRIDAVEIDPADPEVLLHTLSVAQADGSWRNACAPDPEGRRLALPLAGEAQPDGRIIDAPGRIALVCTSGGQGKCVRFGYKPWKRTAAESLRDLYNACIKMVRADYCGNDQPTTREGTRIDIYDDHGIQLPANEPGADFEAGWAPEGAVCVHHVRISENVTLDALAAACPRLKDKVGAVCNEEIARGLGARLFNRSRPN